METIREWLSGGKDYASGLVLLAKYSKNRILLQRLSRKVLPEKLEYELGKQCRDHKLIKCPDNAADPVNKSDIDRIDPASLPEHLRVLWEETAEKYRLSRGLHAQIKLMPDAGQRAQGIEQLENYRKEIRASWEVIDTWRDTQKQDLSGETIDEKQISANRKYLSEGKKSVVKLSGAARAKKLEAMQRRISELITAGGKFDPENQKELEELGMKFNG